MAEGVTIVACPMCGVPHRTAAVHCDSCGQPLHIIPDIEGLKDECRNRKLQIVSAIAAIVAMVVLNDLVFGGGAFILATAPIGWLLWSWIRLRAVKKRLANGYVNQALRRPDRREGGRLGRGPRGGASRHGGGPLCPP